MIRFNTKKKIMVRIETTFDLLYLFTVLIIAGYLFYTSEFFSLRWQYALMSFVLVLGDAFHLIPRIYSMVSKKNKNHTVSLGIGKFITSITMTLFYIFLWEIGISYYAFDFNIYITIIVYSLGILRILLCFFPQNSWTQKNPPLKWAIVRNIPFTILGMIVMLLYMKGSFEVGGNLSYLWLAIFISFVCYLPVVLFSHKNPKIGMLMLPKSCAYVAIVLMGISII